MKKAGFCRVWLPQADVSEASPPHYRGFLQRSNHSFTELDLRLLGRKALSCIGEGVAGLLWPVSPQRVQGTICGGSGSG